MAKNKNSSSLLNKFLHGVEKAGNALPHPAIMFLWLTFFVFVISWLVSALGIEALHPVKKELITAVNLISKKGLHLTMTEMVKNFATFAPLGTVLVAMLGFSIAEKSGLIATLLRLLVLKANKKLLVPAVLLAGVLSHTAGDIGYVLLIPLAAMAFHSAGLNPLAGLAICFAGVSGGFAANILLSTADPMLAGLTQEGARILDPKYIVTPVVNWYFMAASSVLIVGVGSLVANYVTIPFLGTYQGDAAAAKLDRISAIEKRGLWAAFSVVAAIAIFIIAGTVPAQGYLRDPETFEILHSPLLSGIVFLIFVTGALSGLAYGFVTKSFKSSAEPIAAMTDAMVTMAPYIVLVFFMSQFISLFNASNVGLISAVHGAESLKKINMGPVPLMIGFILLTVLLDLVIGSASAKWALMAPVVVPMFMLLGLSPELTQAAYRVADSVVNIISPLMSYFPLILAFANKYDKNARVGTIMALMMPYSIFFLISWSVMLFVWMTLNLPLGPGAVLHYITH